MTTAARAKKKSRSDKPKEQLRTGRKVQVENLRLNQAIVTAWHEGKTRDLSLDEVMNVLSGDIDVETPSRFVSKSVRISDIELCPGQWRTHVHINKTQCYDTRTFVWIVNE